MRKTLIYVVSLLVCLGLVGSVWAGKPGGKKTKENKIPVTVTFRDPSIAPDDLIRSDDKLTYTDGVGGVEASIRSDTVGEGQLQLGTGTAGRKMTLNFNFDEAKCTDDRFMMVGDCRTVARLVMLREWVLVEETASLRQLKRNLNLLAMREGSTAYAGFQIFFPSKFERTQNLLRFGFFDGRPGTVIRTDADTWTIEAVEPFDPTDPSKGTIPSVAVLLEGNEKPKGKEHVTETGRGPLPFQITVRPRRSR